MASALIKMLFSGTGIIGVGFLLYNTTVPTEEQLVSKFSPEIKQKYYQEKQFRSGSQEDHLYDLIRSNAESSRPAWMLSDHVEAPCVTRERDRASWNSQALAHAQRAAERRMRAEQDRLAGEN
ncbi:hypothetical protein V1514DRAFT_64394 [Lipomyces japonicus]|uniref:uncharacterized protein n=1 Tax=Lipomyces japonicus TaxID=56871 RepID=UPI0034CF713E